MRSTDPAPDITTKGAAANAAKKNVVITFRNADKAKMLTPSLEPANSMMLFPLPFQTHDIMILLQQEFKQLLKYASLTAEGSTASALL
jgi:hypothetical protein